MQDFLSSNFLQVSTIFQKMAYSLHKEITQHILGISIFELLYKKQIQESDIIKKNLNDGHVDLIGDESHMKD